MSPVSFTRAGFLRGARIALPLSIGLSPFGVVVGVVAQGKGLSLFEATLMSATVFAGASQLVALDIWGNPAPVLGAALAAFVVNLRMALMGPVLAPWLDQLRGLRLWGPLAIMVDHGFALSVTEMRAGRNDAAFFAGAGVVLWILWIVQTVIGHALGTVAQFAPDHPLYFSATAAFVTLLVPMWRGRADLLPWAVAAVVALATSRALPGSNWYVMTGAVAGAAVGVAQKRLLAARDASR